MMAYKIQDIDILRKEIIEEIRRTYQDNFRVDSEEFASELLTLEANITLVFSRWIDKKDGYNGNIKDYYNTQKIDSIKIPINKFTKKQISELQKIQNARYK